MTKLEQLGRRVIAERLYRKRDSARKRRILKVVYECLIDPSLTDRSFRERIIEAADRDTHHVLDAEIDAEIAKL